MLITKTTSTLTEPSVITVMLQRQTWLFGVHNLRYCSSGVEPDEAEEHTWCSWIRASCYNSCSKKPKNMQLFIKILLFLNFKWSSTCFGRHTAHHQEPKTVQAVSGFVYVEGCRTCRCWTLSGSVRYQTTSNNGTSDNLPRMQNQKLRVQF
jgi:hypothetical protein